MKFRLIILLSTALLTFTDTSGQLFTEADSLKRLLTTTHEDTARFLLYRKLAIAYEYTHPDTAMIYAMDALHLATKMEYLKGEAQALNEIGSILLLTGNYTMALEKFLASLELREAMNDKTGIAVALDNIGIVYLEQGDYRTALRYFFDAKKIDEETHSDDGIMIDCNNIGDAYERMNMPDSALYYQHIAYQKAIAIEDEEYIGPILTSLGNAQQKLKNFDLALTYYRMSLPYAEKISDLQNFSLTYLGMANLYRTLQNPDSSAYYAKKTIAVAQGDYPIAVLDASNLLADLYTEQNMSDSAIRYLKMAYAMNDTLFNQEKIRQLQTLTLNEQMRQEVLLQEKLRDEEIRRHNLQNIGIILFIITFFLIVMFLNKRHVSAKTVEFLGLLALLLFFEFIYMFVYPWIARKTHDIPIFVLVCSVIAASILVPIHKRIERWVKTKMVHHNEK